MPLFEIPSETGGNIVSPALLVKALRHIEIEPYRPYISMTYRALNKRSQMGFTPQASKLGDSGVLAPTTAIGAVEYMKADFSNTLHGTSPARTDISRVIMGGRTHFTEPYFAR